MKIVSLRAQNFKRLKAVEIRPDGNVVRITGKNEQGKSSVLDAIWATIGGAKAIPAVPIRKGEKEAIVEVDLGDLVATRVLRKLDGDDKPFATLIVKSKDGKRFANGQEVLNELIGTLAFDPLAFARAKDADRIPILRGLVAGFDFGATDAEIKDKFEERTIVNREVKRLQSQLEGIVLSEEEIERVDVDALVAELEAAGEHNRKLEQALAQRRELEQRKRYLDDRAAKERDSAAELRRRAADAEANADRAAEEAAEVSKEIAALPEIPEMKVTLDVRKSIETARAQNERADAQLRAQRERAGLKSQLTAKETEASTLTARIDELRKNKIDAVTAAQLPVPGLTFEDDVVMLDGLPFDQASSSRKIRVSAAIASALNPRLRVVHVRDGSLLDADGKAVLAAFAHEHDMQFWIEEVDDTGEGGFVIEDGMVASKPEETSDAA